jgi:NAD(P)-dependent dehydrogenase (short-subunit alcohol dehydrogenase family)
MAFGLEGAAVKSIEPGSVAIVFGSTGGIGQALIGALQHSGAFETVYGFSRSTDPPLDLTDEDSIAHAVKMAAACGDLRLVIDATGFLHGDGHAPEKSWRALDGRHLAHAFAVNAIGPALVMKHVLPKLPRKGKAVFASLSARVGSIGDNGLGGWYGYRASKAALNQLVRTAAIELARRAPDALCLALHPGTVATPLSADFAKAGLDVQSPEKAAARLLSVIDDLSADATGGFYDWRGDRVPW